MDRDEPRGSTSAMNGLQRLVGRRAALHLLAAIAAALGLGTLGVGACQRHAGNARALRVVSVSPNTTEAVFALGAGAALVGRSSYCDQPPEALLVLITSPRLSRGACSPSCKSG